MNKTEYVEYYKNMYANYTLEQLRQEKFYNDMDDHWSDAEFAKDQVLTELIREKENE